MVGNFGKTFRCPALGNNRATYIKTYQFIFICYAVRLPEICRFFNMAFTRKNFQPVICQVFYTKLLQHIQIHIRRVHSAVKRRKHIPAPFKNGMSCAGTQFNTGQRINKGASFVWMQVYQYVKFMLT